MRKVGECVFVWMIRKPLKEDLQGIYILRTLDGEVRRAAWIGPGASQGDIRRRHEERKARNGEPCSWLVRTSGANHNHGTRGTRVPHVS